MSEIDLDSFPFDSLETVDPETGTSSFDREYSAVVFARYFRKFLSNGVYYGNYKNYGENSMKVSLDAGMTIKVATGCGIIQGVDYENTSERLISLERPASGTRVDRVVVKMDATLGNRKTTLYVKNGNGSTAPALTRNDNTYEICIAEITVSSSSNLISSDIEDTRLDTTLCGIVNSLISVDGEELYERFQDYIDSVTDDLVRKDSETIELEGVLTDSVGGTSKNNFTDAYKEKLDGIATGATKVELENSLTSTSTTKALTAAQGKILKETVDGKQKTISYGTAAPSGGSNGDIYIQYF